MSVQPPTFMDQALLKPPVETFNGTNVLSRAIKAGTVKEVHILLERGCDPNQPSGTWGMRPLMIAQYINSKIRQRQVVELLLRFGAVPSLVDNQKRNCLMYACVLQSCESVSSMLQAAEYDFYDADCDGNTLLHVCAMVGNIDILKVVLKYGSKYRCNLNSRNQHGLTALLTAILRLRRECAILLYEQGATPRFSANNFQLIVSAMENMSEIESTKFTEINDLLLRILSDIEGVHESSRRHMELSYPELFVDQCEIDCQQVGGILKHITYPSTQSVCVGDTGYHTAFSSELNQMSGESLPRQSSSLQSDEETPPSYMTSVENLLSRPSYHARRSSSYCVPQVNKQDLNGDWVGTIRQYRQEESCSAVEVASTVKSSSAHVQLSRAVSIPSGGHSHTAGGQTMTPSSGRQPRTRALSRSTTSPHLFSQTSLTRKFTPDTVPALGETLEF